MMKFAAKLYITLPNHQKSRLKVKNL